MVPITAPPGLFLDPPPPLQVIPVSHGYALHQAALNPVKPYWVPLAKHNDVVDCNPTGYYKALREFLDALQDPGVSNAPASEPHPVHSTALRSYQRFN